MTNNIEREKRQRYLTNLIKEGIINVLAEQEPPVPTSAIPPATTPPAPETNGAETVAPSPEQQAPEGEAQFTVELMVDKLNVLRGGRSFTDPEVFGRLTTFFNNLTDEQKTSLEDLLTQLGQAVLGATEEEAGLEDQQQQGKAPQQQQPPPPPQPAAPPPAPAATPSSAPVSPSL